MSYRISQSLRDMINDFSINVLSISNNLQLGLVIKKGINFLKKSQTSKIKPKKIVIILRILTKRLKDLK